MQLRTMLTTFGMIFLAEMGDKTQIAAMTLAAESKAPWSVLIGAAAALTIVSALGVLVGATIGHYLPMQWIKRAAAVAFIAIGALMLVGKL